MKIVAFDQLSNWDLLIDAIYKGGEKGNEVDNTINKIIPEQNSLTAAGKERYLHF